MLKHYTPWQQKSEKAIFKHKGQSRGHEVIDLGGHLKGNHKLSMHVKKFLSPNVQKL